MSVGHAARRSDRLFFASAWLAALAGPVAWAADLEVVYALAPRSCTSGRGMLHAAIFVGLVVAGLGLMVSALNLTSFGRTTQANDKASSAAQIVFLATIGLMANTLFGLVITAEWLAILLLDPCSPT